MDEDLNPANLLPFEKWLEPKPENWQPPQYIYTGSIDKNVLAKEIKKLK